MKANKNNIKIVDPQWVKDYFYKNDELKEILSQKKPHQILNNV